MPSAATPRLARVSSRLLPLLLIVALAAPAFACDDKGKSAKSASYGYGDNDHFSWAVSGKESQTLSMSDGDDWKSIAELMKKSPDGILWFRLDGKTYAVRDKDMLTRAQATVKPMAMLGKKQGEWGSKQGRYGAEQAKLGAQQARLSERMTRLQQRMDDLAEQFSSDGRNDPELQKMRADLSRGMSELGRLQSDLGRQQSDLGRVQSEIGRAQSDLGRAQESAAREANTQLEALAREAIKTGKAQTLTVD